MADLLVPQANILVVEDENIVALDITRGLRRLGYVVPAVCNNGHDAIDAAGKLHPALVLMDIQLKGEMDGIDAANVIRQQFNIPVVFLTAYADEGTLQRARAVEPYGYLLKPFEERELHTAIEVVLQKHRAFEEKLAQSEKTLKLFVNSVKEYAIFMLDPAGNVMSWNQGAESIMGYRSEEVLGKNASIFFEPDDIALGKPEMQWEIAATQGIYEEENWRVRKDGTRFWADAVTTAIRDSRGALQGFGKVVRDLTTKKQAEEALRRALNERDEFLSIASHELKTPLNTLTLQLQLFDRILNMALDDPEASKNLCARFSAEKVKKILRVCGHYSKKLTGLVDDLLDLTRLRSGTLFLNPKDVDLTQLTREVVERLAAGTDLASPITVRAVDVRGIWDPTRMEQIVTNLVSNAIKYGEGKPIAVEITSDAASGLATLRVTDQGMGIHTEMQAKIFDRFQRAVGSTHITGLGLGLYITRQIVEAHGGTISVQSEPGQGSTFTVVLPSRPRDVPQGF